MRRIKNSVRVQDPNRRWKEFCPNEEIFMTSLIKENAQLRYLKRSLKWTAENGECEMLISLFHETGRQLQGKSIDLPDSKGKELAM